ncbi:hypothetical protein LX36DRAFT_663167 [Colletotrichum falcatum]|nr:hypothetical protein LX36DRAFT_663167 [Colletotrichum falcatum]
MFSFNGPDHDASARVPRAVEDVHVLGIRDVASIHGNCRTSQPSAAAGATSCSGKPEQARRPGEGFYGTKSRPWSDPLLRTVGRVRVIPTVAKATNRRGPAGRGPNTAVPRLQKGSRGPSKQFAVLGLCWLGPPRGGGGTRNAVATPRDEQRAKESARARARERERERESRIEAKICGPGRQPPGQVSGPVPFSSFFSVGHPG